MPQGVKAVGRGNRSLLRFDDDCQRRTPEGEGGSRGSSGFRDRDEPPIRPRASMPTSLHDHGSFRGMVAYQMCCRDDRLFSFTLPEKATCAAPLQAALGTHP